MLGLRQKVLQVRDAPNLTKDMIKQQSDPALNRLSQLLVVDRQTILADVATLSAQREKMSLLGKQWERLAPETAARWRRMAESDAAAD